MERERETDRERGEGQKKNLERESGAAVYIWLSGFGREVGKAEEKPTRSRFRRNQLQEIWALQCEI